MPRLPIAGCVCYNYTMRKRGTFVVAVAAALGIPASASAQFISNGGGGIVQIPSSWLAILTAFAAVITLVMAFLAYVQFRSLRRQRERDEATPTQENPGYVFFPIPDERKLVFADAMQGFTEYAKLKGYRVALGIDSTIPGKVGIKFIIVDVGVTVSTAAVRKDLYEYAERFRTGDDLRDMPNIVGGNERGPLAASISARFSFVSQSLDNLAKQTAQNYQSIIDSHNTLRNEILAAIRVAPIGYPPITLNINNTQEGNRMRDRISIDRSPGAAAGTNNTAQITGSSIVVSSPDQRAKQSSSIDRLVELVNAGDFSADDKSIAERYLKNIKDEIELPEPDKGVIANALNRLKPILGLALVGTELYELGRNLFSMFGVN